MATQRDLAPLNPCHRMPLPQPRPRLCRLLAHLRPHSAQLDAHHPATPTPTTPSPAATRPAALRPADIAHFRDFGYCVLPSLFTREEAAALESATLEVMRHLSEHGDPRVASGFQQVDACLAGVEGATHWSCGGFYERHPALRRLLMDERVYSIPEALLGAACSRPSTLIACLAAVLRCRLVVQHQLHGGSRNMRPRYP